MKQNTIIIFIVSTIVLLILLGCLNCKIFSSSEKFEDYESVQPLDCYKTETVYLDDVSGGLSTGSAYIDKKSDTVSIDIDAALPLATGGVFNYLNGVYKVFLSKTDNPSFDNNSDSNNDNLLLLGNLVMKEQRRYDLSKTMPANTTNDFNHLFIVRYSSDLNGNVYKPVIILKGVIRV